ncbi:MAG TPA: anti-sigma factor [Nitriliruptorales bacterium]|nr:anti-sigma factor [Nitriliruptorales bacterium]
MASAEIHTLAGPYALDALPADERRFFEAHLHACDACRAEVAELHATAAKLGAAAAEPAPSGLRSRVLAAVDTVRQDPPPPAAVDEHGLWQRTRGAVLAAAAAVLIVAVGLTGVVARMNARIDQLEARHAQVREILAAEDLRTVSVRGRGGLRARFVVSDAQDSAMMIAEGLPQLPEDRVYELWFISDAGARPAGLFRPDEEGPTVHVLRGGVPGEAKVGLTVEPARGSRRPTTDPLFVLDV